MVRISADSTCDLSSDIIKRFNIEILPLYIIIDDKELRDGVDVTPADIFKYVDSTGKLCKTAAAGSIGLLRPVQPDYQQRGFCCTYKYKL